MVPYLNAPGFFPAENLKCFQNLFRAFTETILESVRDHSGKLTCPGNFKKCHVQLFRVTCFSFYLGFGRVAKYYNLLCWQYQSWQILAKTLQPKRIIYRQFYGFVESNLLAYLLNKAVRKLPVKHW